MQSRRDFLRLLGMAAGASLTGGGSDSLSGDSFPGGPISPGDAEIDVAPLAYQYIPIIKSGDALPGGLRLAEKGLRFSLHSNASNPPPFMGAVVITNSRHIYFHAVDETQLRGVYRIDLDDKYNRSAPKKVIREGDVLPDGTVVADFSDGDVNNGDDFVIGVVDPNGINSIQYASGGGTFTPAVKSGTGLQNVRLAEDITQSQGISDDGNVLFVAEYLNSEEDAEGEGLFVMPAGRPQETRLVLPNQALLPGTTCPIQTMSTTEICPGGRYLVQGSAATGAGLGSGADDGRPQTFLLTGNVGQTPQLLAADPALHRGGGGITRGSVYMCPRMNPVTQAVAFIAQINEDRTALRLASDTDNRPVCLGDFAGNLSTVTPRGSRVRSMLPPVFRGRRQVFFQVFTQDGMEIVRWDGARRQDRAVLTTVLARGDQVNGKTVETILFGCLPEAVNAHGEFVAIVEFTDGETDIFLGRPM